MLEVVGKKHGFSIHEPVQKLSKKDEITMNNWLSGKCEYCHKEFKNLKLHHNYCKWKKARDKRILRGVRLYKHRQLLRGVLK